MLSDRLEILLKKSTAGRWKSLESPAHGHQITSSNSASNQIQISTNLSANQNQVSTNSTSNQSQASTNNDQGLGLAIQTNDLSLNSSPQKLRTKSDIWSSTEVPYSHQNHFGVDLNQDSKHLNTQSGSNYSVQSSPCSTQSSSSTPQSHSKTNLQQPVPQLSSHQMPNMIMGSKVTQTPGSKVTRNVLPTTLEMTDPSYRRNQLCKPSLTGLVNLGNSCFMNSVIQCLSNTSELRNYFIDGRYLADINKINPLGFNGELAKCFSQVVRKLWSGEYQSFQPKKLKSIISSRSSHFGGYQQQDAHEFMSYLLDGLHEDLNRVGEKPQTSAVEGEGRPDVEVARECWEVHRKRNDSYLVDSFQGQFKSTLVCPHCSKVGASLLSQTFLL